MSFIDIAKGVSNIQGTIGSIKNVAQFIGSLFARDEVAIFDKGYKQLLLPARPMKLSVIREQKIMDHPLETGAVVSDFSIILPVTIELQMFLTGDEYKMTYQWIWAYYTLRAPLIVATRADVFKNMIIEGMPHEESPDMMDIIPVTLRLREIQLVKLQYQALAPSQVQKPTDQSTVNRGVQQPKTSILYDIAKSVKNLF